MLYVYVYKVLFFLHAKLKEENLVNLKSQHVLRERNTFQPKSLLARYWLKRITIIPRARLIWYIDIYMYVYISSAASNLWEIIQRTCGAEFDVVETKAPRGIGLDPFSLYHRKVVYIHEYIAINFSRRVIAF